MNSGFALGRAPVSVAGEVPQQPHRVLAGCRRGTGHHHLGERGRGVVLDGRRKTGGQLR